MQPTCLAEEMALHLVLESAPDAVADGWGTVASLLLPLPEHPDDFDWEMLSGVLFQDHDIVDLFTPGLDGAEDPDSDHNKTLGVGDYRPLAWFTTFQNRTRRDPRRPLRR